MKTRTATMTLNDIRKDITNGWKPKAYSADGNYIIEIDFTKETKCGLAGGSFMCCSIRQRELKSLFNRIKKVVPKFKLTKV